MLKNKNDSKFSELESKIQKLDDLSNKITEQNKQIVIEF